MTIANEHLTRQFDVLPPKVLDLKITIIGAGAVGGWACLMLAKMGFKNITVWDFDKVSIENMNSQFFRFSDIDKPKVDALKYMVKDFADVDIKVNMARYEAGALSQIVLCCVDSMEARKNIFEQAMKSFAVSYFIDSRMAVEYLSQFCIDMNKKEDIAGYKKTLFSDDEAVQERCTNKATVYTASLAGSLVAKMVKDIATKNPYTRAVQYDVKGNKQLAWNTGCKEHTSA